MSALTLQLCIRLLVLAASAYLYFSLASNPPTSSFISPPHHLLHLPLKSSFYSLPPCCEPPCLHPLSPVFFTCSFYFQLTPRLPVSPSLPLSEVMRSFLKTGHTKSTPPPPRH